jgi:nucleotide-binding universal stress UspA family protein
MATRGRGGPEEIGVEVGSVTESVVLSAHCPVWAVTVVGIGRGTPKE